MPFPKTLLTVPFFVFVLMLFLSFSQAFSQDVTIRDTSFSEDSLAVVVRSLKAVRTDSAAPVNLDGKLDEAIWQQVPVATGFTQRVPDDGSPASEKTEARVIYTEDAIYVGARAYDSSIDSIAATLFRKDGSAYSDWFYVNIDSYNDNRTGFTFAVNPRGVRKDILLYDDDREDIRWDAVWEAATTIDGEGWTVEMRIPLSQLRFSPPENGDETEWGINFQRRLARNEEISFWSPTPQNEAGLVSQFGRLQGIRELTSPKRFEISPYVSSDLTRAPGGGANPFFNKNEWNGSVGADIKYGMTSDLTLTATVNPDFGQVEADPAVINLSANETYFEEQRPFFLEGNEIFRFGNTRTYNTFGNPLTFYSRRIGRAPRGSLDRYNSYRDESVYNPDLAEDIYTDMPDQTTIAAAAKLSGKTRSGWSVGLLNAYTAAESSPYQINDDLAEGKFTVEPAANYLVARTKKDLDGGNTVFGGFVSAANRNIGDTYFEEVLHSSAYLGGVDFEHNWRDRDWSVSGTFSASSVNGSEETIEKTQLSSARYYNRVDSDKLSLDTGKTSLSGFAGELSVQKSGGENWRSSVTYSEVSPGYEVNDLGFENRADYRAVAAGLIYLESSPKRMRYYEFWTFETFAWNYDGDLTGNYYNTGGFMRFNNLWTFNYNFNYSGKRYLDRLTRGGPVASALKTWNFNFNLRSNQTKKIAYGLGGFYRNEIGGYEKERNLWGFIRLRPATHIQLEISPEVGYGTYNDQYITREEDELATATYGNRYVFSDLDQTFLSASIRLDWTFTPDISLQLYARPYINTGNFYNYKEFKTPRGFDFDIYGEDTGTITYSDSDEEYTVDPDGAGSAEPFSFSQRNYNFRSVQSNTVFRWEYRPGSALYLVWQHDRSSNGPESDFRFNRDFGRLFKSEPTNIFLVKLSYWFGK